MEDILKLIELRREKGHRSIQLLNQNFRKSEISKDNLLYDSILEFELKSDEEAASKIFNTDPNNRNYRNAKSKLKEKLLNNLYFLDYDKKGYTHYEKYEYESMNELHHARILMNEGATEMATKKLLHLLKFSKICELVDIVVQVLVWLKSIYARQGKLSLYDEVELALGYYTSFQQAIRESENLYYNELVLIKKSFSAQTRALEKVPSSLKKITQLSIKFNSSRIELLASRLELLYLRITNNFADLENLCTELEEGFFERKDGEIRVDLSRTSLYLTKIDAYFNLKQFEKGLDFADSKAEYFQSGTKLWFLFYEKRFLLSMHGKKFDLAAKYIRIARTDNAFKELNKEDLDRWNIYRSFLVYFNDEKLVRWGFNLNHFLSYRLNYDKDKAGYSIAVLSARFIYFLRDGELKKLNKTIKAINKFNSSHLDKRSNYRNSVFIRLLNLVPENEYNYADVKSRCENYIDKLINTQIPQDNYSDLEVYPYELLWKEIMNILKLDKQYVHFKFYHFSEA